MEGLKSSDAKLVVYVHPSKSNRVSDAILRELSSHLFKFSEIFDGVLLAYDVVALDNNAKILPGIYPFFGVRLKANLLLFAPRPNMLLEGKVVKLTPESIHVIVLGFASAVVVDEDIREEFEYRIKHGKEVYRSRLHRKHIIEVGTMLRFLVKSLDEEMLHISGSLIPIETGSIHWLDKSVQEISITDRSGIKRDKEKSESNLKIPKHAVVGGEEFSLDNDQTKKSKKRRIKEES